MQFKPRNYILLLALIVITAKLALPALAEDNTVFRHTGHYEMDGFIRIDKQVGDPCRSGAVKKQQVRGYGYMTKSETIRIADHIMTVEDEMEWTTAPDAVRNLSITTTLELCARPMSTAAFSYGEIPVNYFVYDRELSIPDEGLFYAPDLMYIDDWSSIFELYQLTRDRRLRDLLSLSFDRSKERLYYTEFEYLINRGEIISPYHPLVQERLLDVNRKTRQVWSVRTDTEPGHSGIYETDFIAAYGPGPLDNERIYGKDYMWWFDDLEEDGIGRGDRYVGNYFDIEHYLLNTSGDTRRFISMSSPFLKAILEDDFTLEGGYTEIEEDFFMDNLEAGPDAITFAWHELF